MFQHYQQTLNNWQSGECGDGEMAVAFFLHYYLRKRPKPKLILFLDNGGDPLLALQKFQFKKVRAKALHCLLQWARGEWNLTLVTRILSPKEVLNFQAQGIRPVSMIPQEELAPILHREDCLDFFLHDLEHGYMFFSDPELTRMQIGFFQKVQASLSTDIWDEYLGDKSFLARFHYLISDMNTHIEHYRGYLLAMVKREHMARFDAIFFGALEVSGQLKAKSNLPFTHFDIGPCHPIAQRKIPGPDSPRQLFI